MIDPSTPIIKFFKMCQNICIYSTQYAASQAQTDMLMNAKCHPMND